MIRGEAGAGGDAGHVLGGGDSLSPDGHRHGSQVLIDTKPVLMILAVEEVLVVGGAQVQSLNQMSWSRSVVGTDSSLPVRGVLLQQTEAASLSEIIKISININNNSSNRSVIQYMLSMDQKMK